MFPFHPSTIIYKSLDSRSYLTGHNGAHLTPSAMTKQHELAESHVSDCNRQDLNNAPVIKQLVEVDAITPEEIQSIQAQVQYSYQLALEGLLKVEPKNSVRTFVIEQALDYHAPDEFFFDLMEYGCHNEMVRDAYKATDRRQFFNDHYDEIERIRERLEYIGFFPEIRGDKRDWLTCVAVEATAFRIAYEIGLPRLCWHRFPYPISPISFTFT